MRNEGAFRGEKSAQAVANALDLVGEFAPAGVGGFEFFGDLLHGEGGLVELVGVAGDFRAWRGGWSGWPGLLEFGDGGLEGLEFGSRAA